MSKIIRVELVSLLLSVFFVIVGTGLPVLLGVESGPNGNYTYEFLYRSGPVFVTPFVGCFSKLCLLIAAVSFIILLVTFLFFDIISGGADNEK